jgi:hypothetical protein
VIIFNTTIGSNKRFVPFFPIYDLETHYIIYKLFPFQDTVMNLDVKCKVKILLLFTIIMFSAATVAHGTETSGNASGAISCPDGKSAKGELSFTAFMNDSPIYGSWEVVLDGSSDDNTSNGGFLDSGKIDKKKYDLEGKETTSNICDLDKKGNISINGDCGNKAKIQVRADSGWKGTFEGDIDCG